MKYPAFTNDSLTMMYEGIRGALAADNALVAKKPDSGSETPDWQRHAGELSLKMLRRRDVSFFRRNRLVGGSGVAAVR